MHVNRCSYLSQNLIDFQKIWVVWKALEIYFATFPRLLSLFIKKLQGKTWIIHFLKMIKECHQFSYAYESLLVSQPEFNRFSKNMNDLESSWNILSDATFHQLLSLFIKELQGKTWIIHFWKKLAKSYWRVSLRNT